MSREILGHNRSKTWCFQVQPLTCCWHLSVFLSSLVSHIWQLQCTWYYIVLFVLTWMCDNRKLFQHVTLWNNTKCNIVMLILTLTIGQVRCLKVSLSRFEQTRCPYIINERQSSTLWLLLVTYGYVPLEWSAIFLQSWTSTGYFSNSTGSIVTTCRFSQS